MSCFVGQKVFEIMQREDLFARPGRIGSYLHQRLGALQQRHPAIGDVRGRGLYAGVEFVSDRATREPFPEAVRFTTRLVGMMRDRGVIVGGGVPGSNYGKGGDHIQISPPFTISETEIDVIVDTLDEVLTVLSAEIGGRE